MKPSEGLGPLKGLRHLVNQDVAKSKPLKLKIISTFLQKYFCDNFNLKKVWEVESSNVLILGKSDHWNVHSTILVTRKVYCIM